MKGRKPIPTFMKIANGVPGHRPLNENEPRVDDISSKPPEHLSTVARREWDRMRLALSKVLKETDRAALAMYCQAYGRWVEAEIKIADLGAVVASPKGYLMPNPWLSIANKCIEQMTRLLPGMGLTPADRSRIHVEPEKSDEDDTDERLLG